MQDIICVYMLLVFPYFFYKVDARLHSDRCSVSYNIHGRVFMPSMNICFQGMSYFLFNLNKYCILPDLARSLVARKDLFVLDTTVGSPRK